MNKFSPLLLLVGALFPIAADAAGDGRASPPAKSLSLTLTPEQRGAAIAAFVRKWGPYVEQVYGLDVATWSQRMVPQFAVGDAVNIQRALARTTYDGAIAQLSGTGRFLNDEQAITAMARTAEAGMASEQLSSVAASANRDLVFTPVVPCRIVDTRLAGGPIPADSTRSFAAWGQPSYAQYGGFNGDCGMLNDHPASVVLTVAAVVAPYGGYATFFSGDIPDANRPFIASINYEKEVVVSSTVVVNVSPSTFPDYKIYTFAPANYVVDIVGYFAAPRATALDCVDVASAAFSIPAGGRLAGYTPACGVGFTPVSGGLAAVGNSDNQILNAIDPDPTTFFFSMTNTGATKNFVSHTRCCRVPGR